MANRKRITVVGAGSFGTALAIQLLENGHEVTVWTRRPDQMAEMLVKGENSYYLPDLKLPKGLLFSNNLQSAVTDVDAIVFAVPAQIFRSVFTDARENISSRTIIINVAKGIEKGTLLRMSQIAEELYPGVKYAALSGPSHAEEVARFLPTTVAVASKDPEVAKQAQEMFFSEKFRVYSNDDIVGVELGGALKNIIALAAGISDGVGFGDNAKAALMTRGMAEISRLGIVMGARYATFSGLTGMGDLIVTCTSMHSRNRRCGILLGRGMKLESAIREVGMVVEGVSTAEAAYELAQKYRVEMPITENLHKVIKGELSAEDAVEILMGRQKKDEMKI